MVMTFGEATTRLRDGRSTFNEFAAVTRERWTATAQWLMRKWRLPGWVEVQDLVQDLLLGAWKAVFEYDATRGSMPLERYVRVSAVNCALKRMHKARGANQHTYRGSHIDMPFGQMSETALAAVLATFSAPAEQEEREDDRRSKQRASDACTSLEELLVVQALGVTESFHEGVDLVYADEESRTLLRLTSREHAVKVVVRAAMSVADRIQAQAA